MRTGSRMVVTGLATASLMVIGAAFTVIGGTAWAVPPAEPRASSSATARPGGPPPPGWTLRQLGTGQRVTWRAPQPIPVGDARIEFFAGDRPLGVPRHLADGRDLELDVVGPPIQDPAQLQVHAGGRRLDGPPPGPTGPGGPDRAPRPAAPLPTAPVDPGEPGDHRIVSGEYELPDVTLPGLPRPVEQQALVVAPEGAARSAPLVLFLHGRHAVCYHPARGVGRQVWPCPASYHPIPSYHGYQQTQELLAKQG
ncbi:MAG TPA: hypothetical protein VF755_00130, partial [Catenuloplanes sp.]